MPPAVMPALVAGIHDLPQVVCKVVDGRDKPGHDEMRVLPLNPNH